MDEIARDRDRVWHSNRSASSEQEDGPALKRGGRVRRKRRDLPGIPGARRAPLPKQVDAQLATLVKEPPRGDDWVHEMKLDGYRILARMLEQIEHFFIAYNCYENREFKILKRAGAVAAVKLVVEARRKYR